MIRRATFEAEELSTVERLARAGRILGLYPSRPRHAFLRDAYFDTTDGLLGERRITFRIRQRAGAPTTLLLTETSAVSLAGVWEEIRMETPVVGGGIYGTLQEDSAVAARIREMIDPVALRPFAAVHIDREIRSLRAGFLRGDAVHEIYLDRMLVHLDPDAPPTLAWEITLLELEEDGATLESLARRMVEEAPVRNDGMEVVERLRQARSTVRGKPAAAGRRAPPSLSLLVLREGRVALTRAGAELVLPSALGSGPEAARSFARRLMNEARPGREGGAPEGSPESETQLLGFAPVRDSDTDLELWLHRWPADGPSADDAFIWVPLGELLERVGAPRLRSPMLVASTLLVAGAGSGGGGLARSTSLGGTRRPPVELPVLARPSHHGGGEAEDDWLDEHLSVLDFHARVLAMAEDERIPLLERVRFMGIFASNLDEFFGVRMGRLKAIAAGGADPTDRAEAQRSLDAATVRVHALLGRQERCLHGALLPALARRGRRLLAWEELSDEQRTALAARYRSEIAPLLTPRSLTPSPGQPFPHLEHLELSLAVVLERPGSDWSGLAHVPLPDELPRFLEVPGSRDLILLEALLGTRAHLQELFPAFEVVAAHPFRVARYQDVELDEERTESLAEAMAQELAARPFKPAVRLEVSPSMPEEVRAFLVRQLGTERGSARLPLDRTDVFVIREPLDLRALEEWVRLDDGDDRWPSLEPRAPVPPEDSLMERLDRGDLLVHHPYDGFEATVGRLLADAARDPRTVAIKLTLYRTGPRSPVMESLLEALRRGKEVAVFVELKARFDEASNLEWTRRLTEAGAHVVSGLVGYKTHAKTALVVQRDGETGRLTRYVHVGTGNYNVSTARRYTDLGLLSADPRLGSDLTDFFNELTGSAGPPVKDYHRLWVAPHSLARELLLRIDAEVARAKAGGPAGIQAKMNGLSDRTVVKALYRASQAGVAVDLVVRGLCILRPGVPGLSENIRVRSILGRFLEHARFYRFENDGDPRYYLGSADWRKRNLRRRVEVVTDVPDPVSKARLQDILERELSDPRAWILRPDGAYERLRESGSTAQEHYLSERAGTGRAT